MRSEETFTLMQSAREIRVAIDADGDRIGALLNEQHPLPVEEGEADFDYALHLHHLSNHLGVAVDGVVVAEDAYSDEQIRSARVQDERDGAATSGYGKLVSSRQGLEGIYERGGYELAFISGATPQAPRRLCDQLGQTVKLLRRPAVERRALKVQGFTVDFDGVADDLDTEEKVLRGALDRVDAVKKQTERALLAQREAIDVLRRTVVWVGRTTEGLFHLAGEDELADRIRTATRRRPSRPSEPPEEEPAPGSQASGATGEEPSPDPQAPDPQSSESQASDSQA